MRGLGRSEQEDHVSAVRAGLEPRDVGPERLERGAMPTVRLEHASDTGGRVRALPPGGPPRRGRPLGLGRAPRRSARPGPAPTAHPGDRGDHPARGSCGADASGQSRTALQRPLVVAGPVPRAGPGRSPDLPAPGPRATGALPHPGPPVLPHPRGPHHRPFHLRLRGRSRAAAADGGRAPGTGPDGVDLAPGRLRPPGAGGPGPRPAAGRRPGPGRPPLQRPGPRAGPGPGWPPRPGALPSPRCSPAYRAHPPLRTAGP